MLRKTAALLFAILFLTGLTPCGNGVIDSFPRAGTLEGRSIILDAGHGAGGNTYLGYCEGDTMLKLAYKIKPLLEERGAEVYLTRTGPETVDLPARAAFINKLALEAVRESRQRELDREPADVVGLVNELGEIDRLIGIMQSILDDPENMGAVYMNSPYDQKGRRTIHPDLQKVFEFENSNEIKTRFLMISLHSNATAYPINTSVNGAVVYYCSNTFSENANYYRNYSYTDLNVYFGNLILDKIDTLGIKKRSVLENNWFVTREHNIPGVLVENGFHTNEKDRAMLSSEEFLDRLAEAYADTVEDYFEYVGSVPVSRNFGEIFWNTLRALALSKNRRLMISG